MFKLIKTSRVFTVRKKILATCLLATTIASGASWYLLKNTSTTSQTEQAQAGLVNNYQNGSVIKNLGGGVAFWMNPSRQPYKITDFKNQNGQSNLYYKMDNLVDSYGNQSTPAENFRFYTQGNLSVTDMMEKLNRGLTNGTVSDTEKWSENRVITLDNQLDHSITYPYDPTHQRGLGFDRDGGIGSIAILNQELHKAKGLDIFYVSYNKNAENYQTIFSADITNVDWLDIYHEQSPFQLSQGEGKIGLGYFNHILGRDFKNNLATIEIPQKQYTNIANFSFDTLPGSPIEGFVNGSRQTVLGSNKVLFNENTEIKSWDWGWNNGIKAPIAGMQDIRSYTIGSEKVYKKGCTDYSCVYNNYRPFEGPMGEFLIFPQKLTTSEREKVNSYLAIKNDIPLEPNEEGNIKYVNSKGDVMVNIPAKDRKPDMMILINDSGYGIKRIQKENIETTEDQLPDGSYFTMRVEGGLLSDQNITVNLPKGVKQRKDIIFQVSEKNAGKITFSGKLINGLEKYKFFTSKSSDFTNATIVPNQEVSEGNLFKLTHDFENGDYLFIAELSDTCANGATNHPECNVCADTKEFFNNNCVDKCPAGVNRGTDGACNICTAPNTKFEGGECVEQNIPAQGKVESIAPDGTIIGWALDKNKPAESLNLEVKVNDNLVATIKADQLREDINRAENITGNHGFSYKLPLNYCDGINKNVTITAIGYQPIKPITPEPEPHTPDPDKCIFGEPDLCEPPIPIHCRDNGYDEHGRYDPTYCEDPKPIPDPEEDYKDYCLQFPRSPRCDGSWDGSVGDMPIIDDKNKLNLNSHYKKRQLEDGSNKNLPTPKIENSTEYNEEKVDLINTPIIFNKTEYACKGLPEPTAQPTAPKPTETPVENNIIYGAVDQVSPDGAVLGWTIDKDKVTESLNIEIKINDQIVNTIKTNELREDINNIFNTTGNHGFLYKIPTNFCDGTNKNLVLTAIGYDPATKQEERRIIPGTPVNFNATAEACEGITAGNSSNVTELIKNSSKSSSSVSESSPSFIGSTPKHTLPVEPSKSKITDGPTESSSATSALGHYDIVKNHENQVLIGTQNPNTNLGKDGDTYVNTQTGEVFRKINSIWVKVGDIKDFTGQDGAIKTGNNSATLSGVDNPNNTSGKDGDTYVNTQTGEVFRKINSIWVKVGDIKDFTGKNNQHTTNPNTNNNNPNQPKPNENDINQGKNRFLILSGKTDPQNSDGKDGQVYVNGEAGTIFVKHQGSWQKVADIEFVAGGQNHVGENGGLVLFDGQDPQSDVGKDGEFYVNTSTGGLFKKVDGNWKHIGTIKLIAGSEELFYQSIFGFNGFGTNTENNSNSANTKNTTNKPGFDPNKNSSSNNSKTPRTPKTGGAGITLIFSIAILILAGVYGYVYYKRKITNVK